ncbi:MAG TPA: hypothetical protein VFN09_03035 [Rhodanobacteraceae bacterium]|nr:hypothetical protein [Rhodanobacteraceae bacterium]
MSVAVPRVLVHLARLVLLLAATTAAAAPAALPKPILFVAMYPVANDFTTIASVFGNHLSGMQTAGRGGDLWIRYPDGSQRNLTAEAGYGQSGMQGASAIAVRDPAVSWDGTRAIFSMVIGAPTAQYEYGQWYWQLYEVTGLGQGQTVHINRVPGQPADYNNVQPSYLSDGRIVYVSDRPRNGQRHLYPQLDEYEEAPTPSGLWRLDPASGEVVLLEHAPSGAFDPFVDSFGRIVFTRWDHLQRDQQNDAGTYGTFNWSSEAPGSVATTDTSEQFPEPRQGNSAIYGLTFNQFFPWTLNQDGSGEETVNHIGRHDLSTYFTQSFKADPSLHDFIAPTSGRVNANDAENWLQMAEDPLHPGRYLAIDAPEFYTHAAGQIIALTAPPGVPADQLSVDYLTDKANRGFYDGTAPTDFSGHCRDPLPLSDGQLVAVCATDPRGAGNDGSRANPQPRYRFRMRLMTAVGGGYVPGAYLTGGINKAVSFYDPDVLVSYNGPLWEMSPVEVRARPVPPATADSLSAPEQQVFAEAGVDPAAFRQFLRQEGLALIVVRNITSRDVADRQQPFNLRVPGGVETTGDNGQVYDVPYVQFFQADQIRGVGSRAGRRVLAQHLHAPLAMALQPPAAAAPTGGVAAAPDGSIALFVPGQRALTWQSTAADGTPVVRERYWISTQVGEIRACDGCHGVNSHNQAGQPPSQNPPQALKQLLLWWKLHGDVIYADGFQTP